jgi:hypothetical protein
MSASPNMPEAFRPASSLALATLDVHQPELPVTQRRTAVQGLDAANFRAGRAYIPM